MENWAVPELKAFLKDCGNEYSNHRKNELLQLCLQAAETNTDVDPDSLKEDMNGIIAAKLRLHTGDYLSQPLSCDGDSDLSFVPAITVLDIYVLDIYNHLMTFSQYNHPTLWDYKKLEGYQMYVDELCCHTVTRAAWRYGVLLVLCIFSIDLFLKYCLM